jgi:hypothetical protein
MTSGGDLSNDDKTPGLLNGGNVLFNNPWTFLPPGSTGDRPIPAVSMYYRLRFNTTLEIYEYYDPTIPIWVELSGSGTGTVNPGVANDIAFYAASGQAVSPIAGAANSVLVTNGSEVPSLSTTLPSGLSIPGAIITASTAALLSGSVVAAPVAGNDLTNKTYVDSLFSSGVASATGTTNQVLVNGVAGVPTSGAITLSLPQDIAIGSTPTFAGLTLSSIPLGGASGGTGVNNGSSTITLGGSLATVGAFASTFTMTGITGVTFPTSGTLATTSQLPTPAALTKVDDSNVTLTLGGTPATSLLQAVSLTMGWTGQLPVTRGGTELSSATAYSVICGGTTSTGAFQSVASVGTSGQVLTSNGAGQLPTWQAASGAGTVNAGTQNQLAWYAANGSAVSGLATANNGVLVTSAGGVPSISSTLPSGIAATNMNLTTPTLGVATATSINFGGSALSTYTTGGTWTPTITFATPGNLSVSYATQNGVYTRIGNIIVAVFTVAFTPTYTSSSGNFFIAGLPFTVNGSTLGNVANSNTTAYPAGTTHLNCLGVSGTTTMAISACGNGVAQTFFTVTQVVTAVACTFQGALVYLA